MFRNNVNIILVSLFFSYSEYPGLTVMRPKDFRSQYRNKTLDVFDVVFSFSSLEHSGLGRYGDPLNPWGDIMSVAEAWCVSGPSAQFAMAVPTSVSAGKDTIMFNAHRVYGPVMYPFLVSIFKVCGEMRESAVSHNIDLWGYLM